MRIAVIGRGNVGGGLAKRWRDAGHDVQELGRDGGDASDADVLLERCLAHELGWWATQEIGALLAEAGPPGELGLGASV